jgi:hypothetical protein
MTEEIQLPTPPLTHAESARVATEFDELDLDNTKTAFEELDGILVGLSEQVVHTLDQMIPRLDKMQALLSQRGAARKKVLKLAGLPSWPGYAKQYAEKLGCSFRTIQDHITGFRRNGTSGPSQQHAASAKKSERLDARQQSALVKAQLATNEIVAALKSGGDWQTLVAEYDKVAVTPAKLDSFFNSLSAEPDWKEVLTRLVYVLEQCGDRLPLLVLNKTREIQAMLNGISSVQLRSEPYSSSPQRYAKVEKRNSEGDLRWAVVRDGDKTPWDTFDIETDADNAIERLCSPVVSLSDTTVAEKKSVGSVGQACSGCRELHEGIASLAEANPEWGDHQLVEETGCSLTIVRQAKTRFLGSKEAA